MKTITSRTNQEIKLIATLATSRGRKQLGQFVAEGIRTCTTLIEGGYNLRQLYVTQMASTLIPDSINSALITVVADSVMEKISQAHTPSGILGVFALPERPPLTHLSSGLVLANVSDPGNMGALIRTAAACDAGSVVVVEGCDPWSFKVLQATAGTIAHVKIFCMTWQELLHHKKTIPLCALVVKDGKEPSELDLHDSLLVVGNEAHGLPKEWEECCEQRLTLPMPGKIESLNAAVAGSIALYCARVASKG